MSRNVSFSKYVLLVDICSILRAFEVDIWSYLVDICFFLWSIFSQTPLAALYMCPLSKYENTKYPGSCENSWFVDTLCYQCILVPARWWRQKVLSNSSELKSKICVTQSQFHKSWFFVDHFPFVDRWRGRRCWSPLQSQAHPLSVRVLDGPAGLFQITSEASCKYLKVKVGSKLCSNTGDMGPAAQK